MSLVFPLTVVYLGGIFALANIIFATMPEIQGMPKVGLVCMLFGFFWPLAFVAFAAMCALSIITRIVNW